MNEIVSSNRVQELTDELMDKLGATKCKPQSVLLYGSDFSKIAYDRSTNDRKGLLLSSEFGKLYNLLSFHKGHRGYDVEEMVLDKKYVITMGIPLISNAPTEQRLTVIFERFLEKDYEDNVVSVIDNYVKEIGEVLNP